MVIYLIIYYDIYYSIIYGYITNKDILHNIISISLNNFITY